jgi:MFS family permease
LNTAHPSDLPGEAARAPAAAPATAYPHPAYAWYVVAVLLAAYILSYIDREVITLLVPAIKKTLHTTDTGMSFLLGGAFAIFYTLFGVLIAWFADRGNRRWLVFGGVAVWSVATVGCGFAMSYVGLFAARLGVGAGEAALNPPALSMMKDYFPRERLGRAVGIFSAGISSGSGIAFLIGGFLYPAVVAGGVRHWPIIGTVEPWQQMFIWVGLPGMLILLLILSIREPLRRDFAHTAGRPTAASVWTTIGFVSRRWRTFIILSLGMSVLGVMAYGVGFWIPEFFRRTYHLTPADLGYYMRLRGLVLIPVGLCGVLFSGWLSDRWQKRYDDGYLRVCMLAFVLLGVGYVALTLMPSPLLAILMLIPATLGGSMPTAAGTAAIVAIAPATMRAQVIAIYYFVVSVVGFFVGTTAVGLLTDRLFHDESMLRYSLTIVASVAVIASITLLNVNRPYFRERIAEVRLDPLH